MLVIESPAINAVFLMFECSLIVIFEDCLLDGVGSSLFLGVGSVVFRFEVSLLVITCSGWLDLILDVDLLF